MTSKIIYAFWGVVLVVAGGALLAGFDFEHLSPLLKLAFFTVASIAFFVSYLLDGIEKWGWLFPALSMAALAILVGMGVAGVEDANFALPLLLGAVAIPFYAGYAANRKQWGLLIPANILLVLIVFFAVLDWINGLTATVLALCVAAVPFLGLYLLNRSRRWALVMAAILAFCGILSLLGNTINVNEDIKTVGLFILLGLPFAVVAIVSKKNWWAIIPAGTFASLALVAVVEAVVPHTEYPMPRGTLSFDVYIWVLFLGLAATFGLVWLRDRTRATDWAKYPAMGWVAFAGLAYIQGITFAEYWPASAMLVIGALLLLMLLEKMRLTAGQHAPNAKA